MMSKKTYVLDTNVLLSDPTSLFAFDEHNVVIPMIVLEELDRHKSRQDEVGKNARQVNRSLDDMRTKGNGSLLEGVHLHSGGTLTVRSLHSLNKDHIVLPQEFEGSKADNLIIAFMLRMDESDNSTLVSMDINVRIKCDSLGIRCEDYKRMRVAPDTKKFYRGVEVIEVSEELVDEFFEKDSLPVVDKQFAGVRVFSNQIVVIKNIKDGQTVKSAITRVAPDSLKLVPVTEHDHAFGLKPRNKEQSFSLDLLFDPHIKLLTLVGSAGTGKTTLALAAALEQLKGLGHPDVCKYDKLIVSRPVQPVGKELGFLPGTLAEKMEPWISPIKDSLSFLMHGKKPNRQRKQNEYGKPKYDEGTYLAILQQRGLVEVEAITFIRGRSMPNAFIIIDEAQNLTQHELKTIVTRAGEGTKIVLTGDIEQIDNVHVDTYTNGLTYAVEKFKDVSIAGHVTLVKGERGELATIAAQVL